MQVPWTRPTLGTYEKVALDRVWDSGWVSQGKEVAAFEKEICEYLGCRYALAVTSGTTGLMLAYLAIKCITAQRNKGSQSKDSFVTYISSTTFVATCNASLITGIPYISVEVSGKTALSEPKHFEDAYQEGPGTHIFVPVHLLGGAVDVEKIIPLVNRAPERSFIVEDACQAFGTITDSGYVGSGGLQRVTVFSFHAAKLISTVEGGCVTTNDPELYEMMKKLRNHGMTKDYECEVPGFNGRMTDLDAALGRAQLMRVEDAIAHRTMLTEVYRTNLRNHPAIGLLDVPKNVFRSSHCLFAARFFEADKLKEFLQGKGIDSRRFFPPIERQSPLYVNNLTAHFNASSLRDDILLLPMGNAITEEEVTYTCQAIKEFYVQ